MAQGRNSETLLQNFEFVYKVKDISQLPFYNVKYFSSLNYKPVACIVSADLFAICSK